MNVNSVNQALLSGEINQQGVFPHLDLLRRAPVVFRTDIGLPNIPEEPGILLIGGARQYGKSTWLERVLQESIEQHGAGSGLYLNGDEIRDFQDLIEQIRILLSLFPPHTRVKRMFIDEITAIENWQKALKRLADAGEIHDVLIWQGGGHELNFVVKENHFLEVKRGRCSPTEFTWVPQMLPGTRLTVVNAARFETSFCRGITLEDFLLGRDREPSTKPLG